MAIPIYGPDGSFLGYVPTDNLGPPPPPPPPPYEPEPPPPIIPVAVPPPHDVPPTIPAPSCLVTRELVILWYNMYLGRDPENEGAIGGRLGLPCSLVELEIANSPEAVAHRAAIAPPPLPGPTGPAGPPGLPPPAPSPVVRPPSPIPGLDGILNAIDAGLAAIAAQITPRIDALSAFISTELLNKIREAAAAALNVAGSVSKQLADAITGLIPTAIELAGQALAQAENLIGEFLKNAATVEDVAGGFIGAIGAQKDKLAEFVLDNVGGAFASGLAGALHLLEQEEPGIIDAYADRMLAIEELPQDLRLLMLSAKERAHPLPLIPIIAGLISALLIIGPTVIEPEVEKIRQKAWDANPSAVIDVASSADAALRGIRDYDTMAALGQRKGFNGDQFRILADLRKQYPPADVVISAWFRGLIDDGRRDELLTRIGLSPSEATVLIETSYFIPPPQDLVRFLTRDVFIPEFVERFGMDLEYPLDADTFFRRVGLTHETAMLYWRAHWDLPSVSQGYEMYQRGKIEEPDLRRLLRAQGVEPFWRDPIIAVSFNPITRVDVRRIHKLGLLDHAGMVRRYRDIGYAPPDAELLAQFTEKLNSGESKADLRQLSQGLKNRVITAMINGSLDYHEGSFTLGDLGYSQADVDAFVLEAESLRLETHYEQLAGDVRDLYVEGFWTWEQAAAFLRDRTYTDTELGRLREEWDLRRALKAPKAHALRDRDLTVGEVLDAYEQRIFTKDETTAALTALRFDEHEVAALVGIREHRIAKAELDDELAIIQAKYHAGKLDYNGAAGELDKLGLRAKHRDALLAKWEPARLAKTAELGYATIGELVKRKLIDDAAADAYLVKLGYDPTERRLSLALWGSQAAEVAQRAVQAQEKAQRARQAAEEAAARRQAAEAERIRRSIPHLTRADLAKAYREDVITREELRAELIRRTMPAGEVDLLIATIDGQKPRR